MLKTTVRLNVDLNDADSRLIHELMGRFCLFLNGEFPDYLNTKVFHFNLFYINVSP